MTRVTTVDPQAVMQELHRNANEGPEYVRRHAGRILTRIFGPIWKDWPVRPPHLPDAALTQEQREWFHLHPTEPLPAAPTDTATDADSSTPEDTAEDDDDPW
ncbi:MAG: hypothetical protein OXN86_11885 [Chloroflexota bacterium]|nr:hypothetical protein [Chloroflexota bacterium]MDE2893194.1 hypothetical protein [Chloroflexota bacterium]